MFGRATIRLGIGPHSSLSLFFCATNSDEQIKQTCCVFMLSTEYMSLLSQLVTLAVRQVSCPSVPPCQ